MNVRRWAIAGLVVLLAIIAGVLLRWNVAQQDTSASSETPSIAAPEAPAAPATESPSTAMTPAPEVAPAAPEISAESAASRPTFDVVRVEPGGESVIAGRAAPDTAVELLSNGTVIDRTKANEVGEFVMMPAPLEPGSHELVLKTADAVSRQAVTVSVPQPGETGEVLVVVGEPGKASRVVQAGAPDTPTAGALSAASGFAGTPAPEDTSLRIGAVETGGGRLFVQGSGPPGATTVIYLNEAPLAEAKIGPDGRWSLTVAKGLVKGDYRVRIDQTDGSGKVIARAEVPFTADDAATTTVAHSAVPEMAAASAPEAGAPPAAEASVAETPVTEIPAAEVPAVEAPAAEVPPAEAPTVASAPAAPSPPASPSEPPAVAAPAQQAAEPPSAAAVAPAPTEPTAAAPEPAAPPSVAAAPPAEAATANPVIEKMDTVEVKRGDSLWEISRTIYGEGIRYTTIYEANTDQIRNPHRIYPGQIFVTPGE